MLSFAKVDMTAYTAACSGEDLFDAPWSQVTERLGEIVVVITPTFTPGFDMNFGANAGAARASWAAAAQIFMSHFSDNIHINITVDAVPGTTTFGKSFPNWAVSISYADLFDKVSGNATTQDDLIATGPGGSMTAADPTNGTGTWWLTRAQAKALGVIADDMSDDGGTTFGAGNKFTFSGQIAAGTFDFQGIAAHEISEVMGRLGLSGGTLQDKKKSFSLIDNFSYTAPGTKGLRGGPGNNFSIDNGVTLLKLWNDPTANGGDSRDWAAGTNDAFNSISFSDVINPVSTVDLRLMDVIGYGSTPIGSVLETIGRIRFLRAHDLGTGYGKPPDFLDCEVIVLLAEDPFRAFGFKLRADTNEPARTEMFNLLQSAFVAGRPVRLDYIKTGPRVGEIFRVANG